MVQPLLAPIIERVVFLVGAGVGRDWYLKPRLHMHAHALPLRWHLCTVPCCSWPWWKTLMRLGVI